MQPRVKFAGSFPACFDSKQQYNAWMEMARESGIPHTAGVCTDCTPQHQGLMMACDRCENPQVYFKENEDGELEGYAPIFIRKPGMV